MKLEWTIQYGRLVADRFESMARNVKYVIEPDENGWGAKAIRVRDGMKRIDHTPTRMPLQELIEWCEEDAERPAKCPAQPIGPDAPAAETARKMSGKASKFPGTMDASVWASRCTAWFGAFKVPDLAEWFQAALSHGFREGQASVYELVDKAQRERDIFGPVVPGAQAPEPQPAWQASFDARVWASEFMRRNTGQCEALARVNEETMVGWFANALMRGYDEHRWKAERESPPAGPTTDERLAALEARVMGVQAELPMWGRRIEELERAAKVSAEANHLFHHAIEGRVFNLEART